MSRTLVTGLGALVFLAPVSSPALGASTLPPFSFIEPLAGNPPPRVGETRGGMLNSIGLQNIGVERFLADVLPGLARFPARVIVNLFGYEFDDYARLAARVDSSPGIAAVELNVSCPNVKKGGMEFGHDPEILERLVASVRRATGK